MGTSHKDFTSGKVRYRHAKTRSLIPEVYRLHYEDDMSVIDISKKTGLHTSTVESIINERNNLIAEIEGETKPPRNMTPEERSATLVGKGQGPRKPFMVSPEMMIAEEEIASQGDASAIAHEPYPGEEQEQFAVLLLDGTAVLMWGTEEELEVQVIEESILAYEKIDTDANWVSIPALVSTLNRQRIERNIWNKLNHEERELLGYGSPGFTSRY